MGNDTEHHEGFAIARNFVRGAIGSYINENNIEGNIKVWLTGYSRVGAVANLVAGL